MKSGCQICRLVGLGIELSNTADPTNGVGRQRARTASIRSLFDKRSHAGPASRRLSPPLEGGPRPTCIYSGTKGREHTIASWDT